MWSRAPSTATRWRAWVGGGVFAGTGCEEGFCPGGVLDRKTMAVWVVRVLGGQEPPRVNASRFDDVDASSFYAPFIERMADLGVTRGCGDGSGFCPDRAVTRAQMAAFLSRAYHLAAGPDPGFADVPAAHWAVADIARLAASKITVGCRDGSVFCPDQDTTRGEMAVFLWRAENRSQDPAVPVRVPTDGSAVTVPRGGSFAAAFDTVAIEAPAGALSAQAQVSLSETTVGTLAVPEGETLAAEPIAVSITGAHIARPLEFRAELDTTGLTATGVTPAWYSSELGSWVPLDVQDLEVGSSGVTFKATLVDAETGIAATASTPVLLAPTDTAAAPALPVIGAAIVIGILVFAGATAGVAVVALTSGKIHETLKGFFGLVAEEPRCDTGPLPPWVRRVFDSDEARSRSDARLHVCGEASGENLRVKVVNNRNFGVELQPASGSEHVGLPGGNNPEGALDIAIKEAAEEVIGSSYLWPLSQSDFTLPIQARDWKGYLRPTGKTAVVTSIRIGLDMLKVALPAIEQANNATFVTCVRSLIEHANDSTFDAASRKEWTKLIKTGAACFNLDDATAAQLGETVTKALKSVKNALSWLSTIESAATWGLTLADAIKDLNKPDASITVQLVRPAALGDWEPTCSDPAQDSRRLSRNLTQREPFHNNRNRLWHTFEEWEPSAEAAVVPLQACGDSHLALVAADVESTWATSEEHVAKGIVRDLILAMVAPDPNSGYTAITAGDSYTCALSEHGKVACWGHNGGGRTDAP